MTCKYQIKNLICINDKRTIKRDELTYFPLCPYTDYENCQYFEEDE